MFVDGGYGTHASYLKENAIMCRNHRMYGLVQQLVLVHTLNTSEKHKSDHARQQQTGILVRRMQIIPLSYFLLSRAPVMAPQVRI
jgi:hypothetical protein